MACPSRIHPTAIISSAAELAGDVEVGANAIIEGHVKIGPDCVIRPGAYLYGPLTMGRGNTVFTGAVLGDKPQHVYSVRFAARELWGEQASPRDSVYVGLWEDYLEPA